MKFELPSIKRLAAALVILKRGIGDDFRAYEYDEEPGIQVTLGFDEVGWALQSGDNSYTGSAYLYRNWVVNGVYRDTNCYKLAKRMIEEARDEF